MNCAINLVYGMTKAWCVPVTACAGKATEPVCASQMQPKGITMARFVTLATLCISLLVAKFRAQFPLEKCVAAEESAKMALATTVNRLLPTMQQLCVV